MSTPSRHSQPSFPSYPSVIFEHPSISKIVKDSTNSNVQKVVPPGHRQDDKVAGLIENLRNLGIEHFTFSSTWSSAVETAWLFKENGCELEGLVQINSRYTSFRKNEYEKAAAYLFRVA